MTRGAVVLCGGRSTRMGRDKATLPFGGETLLQRVVGIVQSIVDDVTVVGRRDQALPELPDAVRVAHDAVEDRGPLGVALGARHGSEGSSPSRGSVEHLPRCTPEAR